MGKTGGGRGTNQYAVKGHSIAQDGTVGGGASQQAAGFDLDPTWCATENTDEDDWMNDLKYTDFRGGVQWEDLTDDQKARAYANSVPKPQMFQYDPDGERIDASRNIDEDPENIYPTGTHAVTPDGTVYIADDEGDFLGPNGFVSTSGLARVNAVVAEPCDDSASESTSAQSSDPATQPPAEEPTAESFLTNWNDEVMMRLAPNGVDALSMGERLTLMNSLMTEWSSPEDGETIYRAATQAKSWQDATDAVLKVYTDSEDRANGFKIISSKYEVDLNDIYDRWDDVGG